MATFCFVKVVRREVCLLATKVMLTDGEILSTSPDICFLSHLCGINFFGVGHSYWLDLTLVGIVCANK